MERTVEPRGRRPETRRGPGPALRPPETPRTDVKARTRFPRSRESPHNDSDLQHDIVWDASSPSPGRRGRRRRGAANISEIVSRIAPKHGRPEVAEPTLQRWIGDSAAIPCTPDARAPRSRKRSPRWSGADDLLKLAQKFDFNIRQDDDEHRQSLGLPSQDGTLDFLFDLPTRNLRAEEDSGKRIRTKDAVRRAADDEFEDDWDNDDLLNDSLVLEMTQDPQRFCSTQKPTGEGNPPGPSQPAAPPRADPRLPVSRTHPWTADDGSSDQRTGGSLPALTEKPRSFTVTPPDDQNQDLDSLFSSEPVWDDPADDDLLCDMCEDVENLKADVQPSNRAWGIGNQQPANRLPPKQPPPPVLRAEVTAGAQVNLGWTDDSRVQSAATKDPFTFKRPKEAVTHKARCSAADIELKKQQAMARRRQRLQSANAAS